MKLIPLTHGKYAQVDDEDFEHLNKWKWRAFIKGNCWYAYRSENINKKRKFILMHRTIMNVDDRTILIDHRDHDALNNQKHNLRKCTSSENMKNRRSAVNSTSKFLGVSLDVRRDNKWRAQIRIDGNKKHIGYFATEKEAAIAYNKMARTHHKQFANLNIVISAIIVLALSSCTSGRDLGYVYGNLEPAYYPKRFHVPGLIDVQKGSKREGLKIKEAENRKKFSLSLKF